MNMNVESGRRPGSLLWELPEVQRQPHQAYVPNGLRSGTGREDVGQSEHLLWTGWLGRLSPELKLKFGQKKGPLIPILLK